jgi:hypothetical protein
MAGAAPMNGPELDPWQETRPLSFNVIPNGCDPSSDDYHTDIMPSSLNEVPHSTNENAKAEPRRTHSSSDDKNASETGYVDSENAAHGSESGVD